MGVQKNELKFGRPQGIAPAKQRAIDNRPYLLIDKKFPRYAPQGGENFTLYQCTSTLVS